MGLPISVTQAGGRIRVSLGDRVIGETEQALLVAEAGHGPVIYVPRADMNMALLMPSTRRSTCPWKGEASYLSVIDGPQDVAWSYAAPHERVAEIAGHLAFYPVVRVERV